MSSITDQTGAIITERPGSAPPVTGVSTSTAAFVDFFSRGPMDRPVRIASTEEFDRIFGGLAARSEASYGVRQFFANGGERAWVVRTGDGKGAAASITIPVVEPGESTPGESTPGESTPGESTLGEEETAAIAELRVAAANPGEWGNGVKITLRPSRGCFSLEATYDGGVGDQEKESFDDLRLFPESGSGAVEAVNRRSELVQLTYSGPETRGLVPVKRVEESLAEGTDGGLAGKNQLVTSVRTLDAISPEIFNVLCLPAVAAMSESDAARVHRQVRDFANDKRAFYILDPPVGLTVPDAVIAWADRLGELRKGADGSRLAVYFPRLEVPDPLNDYQPRDVGSSGTLAGVWARTDRDVGVWKAPAGVNAVLQGDLAVPLGDEQTGRLNRRGINSLRTFPEFGTVVWGARTLAADPEWKYVNVRRLADYIEQSLRQALEWAIFEENDENLWTAISAQADGFLAGLYRRGAFPGAKAEDAYFVRCDATTTTEAKIEKGVVVLMIGIAPQLPGEFIPLRIEQQLESPV
ncbi:MAG: phage tail sheath family protein [bacterium]|nr:phage tail sheath family protein [bacterium]